MRGNNPLLGNNYFNNLLPPLLVNTFGLEGFNLSLNNNNNLLLRELDLNIATLVNTLTGINLIRRYFSREESFIKSTEFERTETEDPNE